MIRIHPADEGGYYSTIDVNSARRLAMVGIVRSPGMQPPILYADGGVNSAPVLAADSDAVVYVSNLRLLNAEVEVRDASVYLDRTYAQNAWGAALRTVDAQARATLTDVWLDGGNDEAAIMIDAGHVEATFSTMTGYYNALMCSPTGTALVRNSLLTNAAPDLEVDCVGIELSYSALENLYAGVGNQALGPEQADWYVEVDNVPRLSSNAPALLGVTARWSLGDSATDIDGDPRPDRDGTMTFAGADVIP